MVYGNTLPQIPCSCTEKRSPFPDQILQKSTSRLSASPVKWKKSKKQGKVCDLFPPAGRHFPRFFVVFRIVECCLVSMYDKQKRNDQVINSVIPFVYLFILFIDSHNKTPCRNGVRFSYFSGAFAILPPLRGYTLGVSATFSHKIRLRGSPLGSVKSCMVTNLPPSF